MTTKPQNVLIILENLGWSIISTSLRPMYLDEVLGRCMCTMLYDRDMLKTRTEGHLSDEIVGHCERQ